jgi:WD40 repeat protein
MLNQITQEKIPPGFTLRYPIKKQAGIITDMAWSPDGQMLAIVSTNSTDDTIDICDTVQGKRIWKLEERHTGSINSIAWSPEGKCKQFVIHSALSSKGQ